jgi:hypothetical protein
LPAPESPEAKDLAAQLSSGNWHFRRKQRLDPKQSEFQSLDDWLSFVRSNDGVRNAGGGITRYLLADEVDAADLAEEVRQMARIFRPLMEHVGADAPPTTAPEPPILPITGGADETLVAFADLLETFLREFTEARRGPFQKTDPLWNAMSDVKSRLEKFAAVRSRPDLLVNISVGQGNWAAVPWIALLNTKVTRSTQEGIYVVFLIATSLDRIFLTLNQGTTKLVQELGQREAQKRMLDVAGKTRALVPELASAGFALDNEIELGGGGWLAKNYEIGTIAHVDFDVTNVPHDDRMNELLEAVLEAYDSVIDAPSPERQPPGPIETETPQVLEPYGMDDALSELFLEQPALERLLTIWSAKKNLILQGCTRRRQKFCGQTPSVSASGGERHWPHGDHSVPPVLQLRRFCPRISTRWKGRVHASGWRVSSFL